MHKLIDVAHMVPQLLKFKVYGKFWNLNLNFSFFPGVKRLKHDLLNNQIITCFQLPLFKNSKFRDCRNLKFLK